MLQAGTRDSRQRTGSLFFGPALPNELPTQLPNPRVAGIRDVSEASAADVPARIHELRMVEDVEEFCTNFESF
jgi:hypothetical protein